MRRTMLVLLIRNNDNYGGCNQEEQRLRAAEDRQWYCRCDIIGIARILSGVHFFSSKSWRPFTFFSRRFKRRFKTTNWSSKSLPTARKCHKNWLLLCLRGCTWCAAGVYLQIFPVIRLKKFSPPCGRLFQTRSAATGKVRLRSSIVDNRVYGDNRRRWRGGMVVMNGR